MHTRAEKLEAFGRLLDIMDELREKCPWDKKQTFESLRHLTIEETHELADAIIDADIQEIKKETGDVLLHMVFYAKLGSEIPEGEGRPPLHHPRRLQADAPQGRAGSVEKDLDGG